MSGETHQFIAYEGVLQVDEVLVALDLGVFRALGSVFEDVDPEAPRDDVVLAGDHSVEVSVLYPCEQGVPEFGVRGILLSEFHGIDCGVGFQVEAFRPSTAVYPCLGLFFRECLFHWFED